MIVDSSALVAIVLEEARGIEFITKMTQAAVLRISAVSLTEASIVLLSRGGQIKVDLLDALIVRFRIDVVPVDRGMALLAREAFVRYGKGRDKASLNFGDCFPYALAKHYDEPLLFQGDDFKKTDVVEA